MPSETNKRTTKPRATRSTRTFHRDWMSMLLPVFITIGISVVAQVGTGIWQSATFKSQVVQIDNHQKEQDAALQKQSEVLQMLITRLPIDYVPRKEIEENRERNKELREMENTHLDKLDSKIDLLLSRNSKQ